MAIITGHEAEPGQGRLDWDALARIDTLVVLMGVENLGRVVANLLEHGRPARTPAALVYKAYWDTQRVVRATLATIVGASEAAGIAPPATLIVGEVVAWAAKLEPPR